MLPVVQIDRPECRKETLSVRLQMESPLPALRAVSPAGIASARNPIARRNGRQPSLAIPRGGGVSPRGWL